ncbi:MAG: FAD-dependent oxidoreductase [Bauldia sp.]
MAYDCAVVGGGIAGLAIAEIFARSGRSVVLIERNARLCQEASAALHGWFHFGSLYSIFPQNHFMRAMIGGVEDLLDTYACFPNMNIVVAGDGRLGFPQKGGSWFRDEPIEYIVAARNDPDFDMDSFRGIGEYGRKLFFLLTWEMAIKQFISRHQRFHSHNWRGAVAASRRIPSAGWADYSRQVISKPRNEGINLDPDTHFRIVGFDRPMQATAIIVDLLRSLIGCGGEVITGAEVTRVERTSERTRVHTTNGAVEARAVVIAAGKGLSRFLERSSDVRVVSSPLLVAHPPVADVNFVRLTPFVERSINHLHHRVGDLSYSLIGGGYVADPDDRQAVARASERLVSMARSVFPRLGEASVVETYRGEKAEIAGGGGRNYQYGIREIDRNVLAVVPGKFSLAFSLAVETFRRLTGESPTKKLGGLGSPDEASRYAGQTRHAAIMLEAMGRSRRAPAAEDRAIEARTAAAGASTDGQWRQRQA